MMGEEGDFWPPITLLDWALFCVKNVCPMVGVSCEGVEDQTMALLTAIDEDSPWEIKRVCFISRGRRELLNLACSINYENTGVGFWSLGVSGLKTFFLLLIGLVWCWVVWVFLLLALVRCFLFSFACSSYCLCTLQFFALLIKIELIIKRILQ
jgi:hypothetical protein